MGSMPAPEAVGASKPIKTPECGECGAPLQQQVPYIRRVLIKALLRAIAMANYAQAASVRQLVQLSSLWSQLNSLRTSL